MLLLRRFKIFFLKFFLHKKISGKNDLDFTFSQYIRQYNMKLNLLSVVVVCLGFIAPVSSSAALPSECMGIVRPAHMKSFNSQLRDAEPSATASFLAAAKLACARKVGKPNAMDVNQYIMAYMWIGGVVSDVATLKALSNLVGLGEAFVNLSPIMSMARYIRNLKVGDNRYSISPELVEKAFGQLRSDKNIMKLIFSVVKLSSLYLEAEETRAAKLKKVGDLSFNSHAFHEINQLLESTRLGTSEPWETSLKFVASSLALHHSEKRINLAKFTPSRFRAWYQTMVGIDQGKAKEISKERMRGKLSQYDAKPDDNATNADLKQDLLLLEDPEFNALKPKLLIPGKISRTFGIGSPSSVRQKLVSEVEELRKK